MIIYDYKNMNAIAIRIKSAQFLEKYQTDLQKVKGVLAVNKDDIQSLY